MGHQFVRLLGRRIEADGVVHVVMDGKGHLRVGPVDGARGRKDQVPDVVMAAPLQDIDEADEVTVHVGMGVRNRIADPGLGGEIDDDLGLLVFKQGFHGPAVGELRPDKAEVLLLFQDGQAGLFEGDVVVVVQVVQADHVPAVLEQPPGKVKADEPCGPGNQYFLHCFLHLGLVRPTACE